MKKVIFILLISLFMIIPFSAFASDVEITKIEIEGNDQVEKGQKISLTFNVNLSGIDKKSTALGVYMVDFAIDFDSNVLTPVSMSSPGFESYLFSEGGKKYVLGIVEENTELNSECVEGLLYCDNFKVTIDFFAQNVVGNSTTVTVSEAELALLDMVEDREYTTDDIEIVESTLTQTKTITLLSATEKVEEPPKSIVDDSKPVQNDKIEVSKKDTNKNTETNNKNTETNNKKDTNTKKDKSSNNYLKSLIVKDYNINFNKDLHLYDVDIVNDLNKVDVEVELEDAKATYKVIGADDLKKNDYKIKVEVTSESGKLNTYVINFHRKQEKIESAKSLPFNIKMSKKNIMMMVVAIGAIFLLILIIWLIIFLKNRKLEKSLDQL